MSDPAPPMPNVPWIAVRRLGIALAVLLVAAAIGAYAVSRVSEVQRGGTTVLVEGRPVEGWTAPALEYAGVVTVVDGCVAIRQADETFAAVWPRGSEVSGAGREVQVAGFAVGTPVLYGRRGLTRMEAWSVPSPCSTLPVRVVLDPEVDPAPETR